MLGNPMFEESYARLFGQSVALGPQADDFFAAFYERFLQDPEVSSLFADTDLTRQAQMLRTSLLQFVSYYVTSDVTPELIRLAVLHNDKHIPNKMFDAWLQALIETVEKFDPKFDEAVRLAWCWALSPGLAFMKIYPIASKEASQSQE
jgi:truncated hemoglobin YjbI